MCMPSQEPNHWFIISLQDRRLICCSTFILKALVLFSSIFFIFHISQPYVAIGQTRVFIFWSLWRLTCHGFSSNFVILYALLTLVFFLPWISTLHSASSAIFDPKYIKSVTCSSRVMGVHSYNITWIIMMTMTMILDTALLFLLYLVLFIESWCLKINFKCNESSPWYCPSNFYF